MMRKAFLVIAGVLSLVLAAGSALAIVGIHVAEGKVERLDTRKDCVGDRCIHDVTPAVGGVVNYLILGSDSRQGFDRGQSSQFGSSSDVTGQRSDTIMVVHADLTHQRTTVISIPRDLYAYVPGHGWGKINGAFNYGPNATVQTVKRLFGPGFPINHFVEVNFLGFMRVVNALGGVPVCIDRPMIDTLAGLKLPHAGCYNLQGPQALAFVRARHVQGDAIPDFSRISRQQLFIRAAMQKILAPQSLLKLPSLIDALSKNFVRDDRLSLYAIKELTSQLATVGEQGVDFRVVPSVPDPTLINGVSYVQLLQPAARKFFSEIRQGKPLGKLGQGFVLTPISPANITIRLYDASSGGAVDDVYSYLLKAGFNVLPVEAAPANLTKTQLIYGPTNVKPQGVVASYLPKVPPSFDKAGTPGATAIVVIGPDFRGID